MPQLVPGDAFPTFEAKVAGGGRIAIPDDLGKSTIIVLFYRGYW